MPNIYKVLEDKLKKNNDLLTDISNSTTKLQVSTLEFAADTLRLAANINSHWEEHEKSIAINVKLIEQRKNVLAQFSEKLANDAVSPRSLIESGREARYEKLMNANKGFNESIMNAAELLNITLDAALRYLKNKYPNHPTQAKDQEILQARQQLITDTLDKFDDVLTKIKADYEANKIFIESKWGARGKPTEETLVLLTAELVEPPKPIKAVSFKLPSENKVQLKEPSPNRASFFCCCIPRKVKQSPSENERDHLLGRK